MTAAVARLVAAALVALASLGVTAGPTEAAKHPVIQPMHDGN